MIKTIIIDDERIIREGLKMTINWNDLGFTLIGEAKDGEEAIRLIQSTRPEVIITDIRMPFIDGLELIEFIRPTLPDTFIIILSGHDEFHYAQKALQLGVRDFLLKPLDIDYFEKLLKKIKYEYTMNKNKNKKHLLSEDLKHLQLKFIDSLFHKKYGITELEELLIRYDLTNIKNFYFAAIVVQIDNFHLTIADLTFDQINYIHENYFDHISQISNNFTNTFIVEGSSGDAYIVICHETLDKTKRKKDSFIHKLRAHVNQNVTYSITISSSQIWQNISSLMKAYREALEASNNRFIAGYNQNFVYTKDITNNNNTNNDISYLQIDFHLGDLSTAIYNNNEEALIQYIEGLFDTIINNDQNSTLYITMFATSIYVELLNLLNTNNLSIDNIYNDPLKVYKRLTLSTNIYDIKKTILDLSLNVSEHIGEHKSSSSSARIKDAKAYISENYTSPNITLQEVAEHVNMGVCYFSSMFKQETGDSFINYLTEIRINKAKELLKTTHYKTYEVANRVGYNTPTYFSTLFKKITGKSPSSYRRK